MPPASFSTDSPRQSLQIARHPSSISFARILITTLSPLAAAAAQDHWTGHYESLKEHFKIEDEIMHPFVKTRVDILGDAFRESHEELAELAHAVDRYSLR